MRDLATYEHNFAILKSENRSLDLRERLTMSIGMIEETRAKCNKTMTIAELNELRKIDEENTPIT